MELPSSATEMPFCATHFFGIPPVQRLAHAAAIMRQCDLVITVDSSMAHLAGALGVRTWVLAPYAADWRWQEKDGTSVWYQNVRVFRQKTPGDWAGVVRKVVEEMGRG